MAFRSSCGWVSTTTHQWIGMQPPCSRALILIAVLPPPSRGRRLILCISDSKSAQSKLNFITARVQFNSIFASSARIQWACPVENRRSEARARIERNFPHSGSRILTNERGARRELGARRAKPADGPSAQFARVGPGASSGNLQLRERAKVSK